MLCDFGLVSDEYDLQRRVYNFNKYVKKFKYETYYLFDDIAMHFFEKHFDIVITELAHFDIEEMTPFLDKVLCDRMMFWHVHKVEVKFPKIYALKGTLPYDVLTVEDGEVYEV